MSSAFRERAGIACVLLLAIAHPACERESRRLRPIPAAGARPTGVPMTGLAPGAPGDASYPESPYQDKAWHVAEGKKLFSNFNCVGCHAHGGGGMGPPLMDGDWIYGAGPRQIFASIVEGRPNGMPAFGGKIPETQVWQLVAYVQSLGGHVPMDVAPGRSDHMSAKPPEMSLPEMPRRQAARPPGGPDEDEP